MRLLIVVTGAGGSEVSTVGVHIVPTVAMVVVSRLLFAVAVWSVHASTGSGSGPIAVFMGALALVITIVPVEVEASSGCGDVDMSVGRLGIATGDVIGRVRGGPRPRPNKGERMIMWVFVAAV